MPVMSSPAQAHPPAPPPTLGLVLAGGLARRMGGGDKALIPSGAPPISTG
jgi:molybdopterin-guanine dinucleotide biosynthesis protein A